MGQWVKKAWIAKADGQFEWNKSHIYVVCADTSPEHIIRIYYSARNKAGQSVASFFEISKKDLKVSYWHPEPILPMGTAGYFDDSGLTPTWIMDVGSEKWLYYVGWNVHNTVPYHNAIGLATSTDGIHFTKKVPGPVISTIANEPLFNGTASIILDQGIFKMWYLNCIAWLPHNGQLEPSYHIKYASSADGINWQRNGQVAIELAANEGGISRPTVLLEDNIYKMWYSYRGKYTYRTNKAESYRIGYAESVDGITWQRKDHEAGLSVSETGWDSDMVEYPNVVKFDNKKIMFYNGNGFGASGFGYAIWQE
jgi:hypothetical protein